MRHALAAVLVSALTMPLAAAAGAPATDWEGLPYMSHATQVLFVSTDRSWGGTVVAGSRWHRPQPNRSALFGRSVPRHFIWARTCSSRAQVVTFTKTIQAPGVPAEGTVGLQLGYGLGMARVLTDGELRVNGVEINGAFPRTTGPRWSSTRLSARALAAFRYGKNTLTIRVRKARTRRGEACQNRNRTIGVLADLQLQFKPDLEAVALVEGREKYVKAAQSVTEAFRVRLRNRGPSGSVGGRFEFTATFGGALEGLVGSTGPVATFLPPLKDCKGETDPTFTISRVTCSYTDIPAGTEVTQLVHVSARPRGGGTFPANEVARINATWQVTPVGYESGSAPNVQQHTTYVCGPAATHPSCPK